MVDLLNSVYRDETLSSDIGTSSCDEGVDQFTTDVDIKTVHHES